MPETASILVLEAGLLTTVQDLGRPGLMRFGVSPGGGLDRAALILGNRLVGNEPGAAALEITLVGPALRVSAPVVIALTGADFGAAVNGSPLPTWQPVALNTADEVTFDPAATSGARAFLCVAGGIEVEPVMGSRSTDLFGGFGGWHGRALQANNALPVGESSAARDDLLRRRLAAPPPAHDLAVPIRVTLGPQRARFTDEGVETFLGQEYRVAAASDRMGMRLSGVAVGLSRGADLISEGIAHGAVQVPGDGQPIVLLAARQTIGGYPKIATAIGADLDALGQRRPGDPVRFRAVDLDEARRNTLAYRALLGEDAIARMPSAWAGVDSVEQEGDVSNVWDAWGAPRVAELIPALATADITSLSVELSDGAATVKIELRRDATGRLTVASAPVDEASDAADQTTPIVAPLLGAFYRRRGPDEPLLVEDGQMVEANQTIGLLEVMKTYHDVTAPHAGIISFLAEDGQFIEYGQVIARLSLA